MVGPKKEALAIAEGQLKEAEDKLAVKKATRKDVLDISGHLRLSWLIWLIWLNYLLVVIGNGHLQ